MHRIEYKVDIDNSKKNIFYNFLEKKKAKQLYEKRLINSIYFDNNNLEIYNDSTEGLCPRKKIRLRYYGSREELNDKKIFLEKKFTNFSGRSKVSNEISNYNFYLKYGILDSKYGLCYPKTIVSYLRNYYIADNFRITFDEKINFYAYDLSRSMTYTSSINEIIVEIKTNEIKKIDELKEKFPFSEVRFSKYCKSIEKLFRV